MGAEIINAIKSGLGLISDLAREFLSGFSTLFWDATANQGAGALTTFGNWALVMLGVAVSFSVIRLVMSLIRSNTGI